MMKSKILQDDEFDSKDQGPFPQGFYVILGRWDKASSDCWPLSSGNLDTTGLRVSLPIRHSPLLAHDVWVRGCVGLWFEKTSSTASAVGTPLQVLQVMKIIIALARLRQITQKPK